MYEFPADANREIDESAEPWKQRFHVPVVAYTELALKNTRRGLAISDRSGESQLYAWDIPADRLEQLTHEPTGVK